MCREENFMRYIKILLTMLMLLAIGIAGCSAAALKNRYEYIQTAPTWNGEGREKSKRIEINKAATQPQIVTPVAKERKYIVTKKDGKIFIVIEEK
jgi:hypothetical protein